MISATTNYWKGQTFSVERLMEFLTELGQDVEIAVRPTRKHHGKVSVVVAGP